MIRYRKKVNVSISWFVFLTWAKVYLIKIVCLHFASSALHRDFCWGFFVVVVHVNIFKNGQEKSK